MPRSPKKECRYSRCKNAQTHRGYCGEHQDKAVGWFRTTTKSRHQRGYGTEWVKARTVKLKTNPLCEYCLEVGVYTTATEVDHVLALALGGSHKQDNLKSTCSSCHKVKTASDRTQVGRMGRGD